MGPVAAPKAQVPSNFRGSQLKGNMQQMHFDNGPTYGTNWLTDFQPAAYTNAKTLMSNA